MSVSIFKKIAVVTGASSGIGAVYADRLAARGYDLVIVARRGDRLEALSEKILKTYAGTKIEVITADLAKESDPPRRPGNDRREISTASRRNPLRAGQSKSKKVSICRPRADRIWLSASSVFRLNPYAGGEVRNFVHTLFYEQRLGVHRPVTIEARLYLNGQYQTLVQKRAVIQGGPDDPDLVRAVTSVTENLLGPSGAYRAIYIGRRPAAGSSP